MKVGDSIREGETALAVDPSTSPADAGLVFIGRISSPWASPAECPKNPNEARQRGERAVITLAPAYREGLAGLELFSHIIVLVWLDRSRRHLLVQKPKHLTAPRGVFALRSPVRPNPIGLSVVRVLGLDAAAGRIEVDAIDFLDGTPVIDIKPYLARVDAVPDAKAP